MAGIQTKQSSTTRSVTSKDLGKSTKMLRVVNHNVYNTQMTYMADDIDKIECTLNQIYTIDDQIKNKYP